MVPLVGCSVEKALPYLQVQAEVEEVEELPRVCDSRMVEEAVVGMVNEGSPCLQMSSLKVCELLEEA